MISLCLWLACLLCFILVGPLYLLIGLVIPPKRLHPVGRWACRALLRCAGQRVVVEGSFPPMSTGPFIYVFNHTSLLDTFVVIAAIPEFTTAVGKKEQFSIPIWGWILRRWGAVPIDRSELKGAIQSLETVGDAVAGGLSLLVAPEGTRSPDGRLASFKKGPFHIALQQRVPVVPLLISGAFEAKNKGSWVIRPGVIRVRVLASVHPNDLATPTVEAARDETRGRFVEAINGP